MDKDPKSSYIHKLLISWSPNFIYQIFKETSDPSNSKYYVEICKPTNIKPIPEAIVKMYFTVTGETENEYDTNFFFENEQLIHNLTRDFTIRSDRFEYWVIRLLNSKVKMADLLHLGSEFEYTRITDDEGKPIDPFEVRVNLLKDTDLSKVLEKEICTDLNDPRFAPQLNKSVKYSFRKADKNKSGILDYNDYFRVMKHFDYNLSDWDIQIIFSILDNNLTGTINYNECGETAFELILSFLLRNNDQEKVNNIKSFSDKIIRILFSDEIKKSTQLITKQFKAIDTEASGLVTINQMKEILGKSKMISRKEISLMIIRNCQEDKFTYTFLGDYLLEIRGELTRSMINDLNSKKIKDLLLAGFREADIKQIQSLSTSQFRKVLLSCSHIFLTYVQVYELISFINPKLESSIKYEELIDRIVDLIILIYGFQFTLIKAYAIEKGGIQIEGEENNEEGKKEFDEFELFGEFKKMDNERKGFLEVKKYKECLLKRGLNLNENELNVFSLFADIEEDNRIDYEEFMKHFEHTLKMVKLQNTLYTSAQKIRSEKNQAKK